METLDGYVVAQAQQVSGDNRHKKRTANALLIAAAPELLEELKDVLECYDYPGDINYQRIRDLISKATGGE